MEYTVEHSGTKGMKWGYTDGKRNGKRIAGEGFDIKETKKRTMSVSGKMYIPGLANEKEYSMNSYFIKTDSEDWTKVDKETYDNTASGAHLYYNGEKVSEIISDMAEKVLKNTKDLFSDVMSAGEKFLNSFFKK